MTAAAAFPVAAQRLVRSAAARRALQVTLFLGGLLALGLLFGGRAQAAEVAPEVPADLTSASASASAPAEPADAVEPADAAEPVRKAVDVEPVRKAVDVEPVRKAVRTAADTTGTTADTASNATGIAADATGTAADKTGTGTGTAEPIRSTATTVTRTVRTVRTAEESLRNLTEGAAEALPKPEDFPRPALPGTGIPLPEPVLPGTAPGTGDGGHTVRPGADGGAHTIHKPHKPRPDSTYKQRSWSAGIAVTRHIAQDGGFARAARHHQPPLPSDAPAPPYGIAGHSASDCGSQRHGDPGAVAFSGGAAFRLVAAGGAATAYYPVRDRHRDILEFPG
ncbi:hypothetical protein ACFQVC_24680 [Streptomyces monticola]|uniref:Secreted protein n=1 Tax=Streptomyces monticola TaxID=2666263 RepID=A0ABW2JMN0_9ACTN